MRSLFTTRPVGGEPALLELRDNRALSSAELAPARGGLVTGFRIGGDDVLFLDGATLRDRTKNVPTKNVPTKNVPTKNVRGGVPVLFPTPGRLAADAWVRDGRAGKLPQHGFARNVGWELVGTTTDGAAATMLRLASSDETRPHWPWEFVLEFTWSLRGNTLRCDQLYENRSDTAMPFAVGFHPYFRVTQEEKSGAHIETGATRAFDNVAKKTIDLVGIDLTAPEVDLHLLDHGCSASALRWAHDSEVIHVRCAPEFTHWVVWTLAGRDFVCLEPWTAPANAMNTGERLMTLAPGESRTMWMSITRGEAQEPHKVTEEPRR